MAGAHFVFLALVALALSFATPPFQVPDEHQHFFRAFQLSEGTLKGETRDGRSGGVLPASLGELAATYLGSRYLGSRAAHLQTREIQKFPAETTWTRLSTPLNPERREFLDFTGAAPYAPLAYAPQVVGIEIGRLFGAGVLTLLFLARAANALAAALLMATAGLILPYGQLLLIGASLLPMSLALFGSVSPDASTIGCCFVFCAIAARASRAGRWSGRDVASACAAGVVVCTIKPVYAPMLLLGLPAALQPGRTRNILIAHAMILAIVVGASALWLGVFAAKILPTQAGVDVAAQLSGLLSNPLDAAHLLETTVAHFWVLWVLQLIGKLGWADVTLPLWMYALALIAFVAAVGGSEADRARPGRIDALWAVILAGGCFVLILISLYLLWTPVGNPLVLGVQGRYFLPLIAVSIVALSRIRLSKDQGLVPIGALALVAFAIEAIATAPVILSTYRVI